MLVKKFPVTTRTVWWRLLGIATSQVRRSLRPTSLTSLNAVVLLSLMGRRPDMISINPVI